MGFFVVWFRISPELNYRYVEGCAEIICTLDCTQRLHSPETIRLQPIARTNDNHLAEKFGIIPGDGRVNPFHVVRIYVVTDANELLIVSGTTDS